jgi:RNA polymerase sigma-70 factor (ECF subfamily)
MDPALVIQAQAGDEAAFAQLTQLVSGRLNRVAFSILRDREQAQDATQQGLIDIWRKLPTLRDPARFEAWSYRVIVHACYAEAKRSRRLLSELFRGREAVAPDDIGVVDDRDQLERAFRRLSVDQRAVVVLHYYIGLPLREVADVLDIAEGTAHSRLGRAMDRLRMALRADDPARGSLPQEVPG